MMEKEPDSMAVTMKQDYAASEVYSTTSEAPPAYKIRQANSVKIARIVAVTVILSSFILGSFMLASTYLQAKQSCDQMQTLDAVLNKELMLEAMQQELPKAQALMQDHLSADEASLQTIERDEKQPPKEQPEPAKKESTEHAESDDDDESADGESDESADMNANRVHIKLPLDLNLSELAHAMLRENQKSKMNCVVERRRSEELVDSPAKTMRLPFGMEINTEPKKQKVTGERIAIFCETGNEPKNEDAEPVRQVLIPIPPVRTFGPITHLPQQMPPQPIMRQMPRPIFPIPMMNHHNQQMPPAPAQMMQAPHPEGPMIRHNFQPQPPQSLVQPPQPQPPQQPQPTFPQQMQPPRAEVRIQFQRIPIPEAIRPFLPPQVLRNGPEQSEVQVREVPLEMALQKVGLSADELKDIHEIAAQKFTEQLKQLIGEMADSEESEEETDSYRTTPVQEPASQHSEERELQEQQPPRPQEPQPQNIAEPQILPMGRAQYARSLVNPISLPGKVVESSVSDEEAERPHYVQPRSV